MSNWGARNLVDQTQELEMLRLSRLTDGQRDCLRLVGEFRSSKEIARALSISPHTVDQRLKRATALLEVDTRFEAARLFLKTEGVGEGEAAAAPYQPLVYQSPDLLDLPKSAKLAGSFGGADQLGDEADGVDPTHDGEELYESQARYFALKEGFPASSSPWTALVEAAGENRLSVHARLALMVLIAICSVMALAALVSVVEGLSRLT